VPATGPGSRVGAPTPPRDPAARLALPLGRSGLPAASALRRAGGRLGLASVRDLLFHLPRRYDDLREMRRLGDLFFVPDGETVSARVRVAEIRVEASHRRRVQRTTARLEDDSGVIEATWFGRRFIERRIRTGDTIVVSGRLKRFAGRQVLDDPEFARDDGSAILHAGRIVPVYRLTDGILAASLRRAMRAAIDLAGAGYPEYLPPSVLAAEDLPAISTAIEEAHFPTDFDRRDAAIRRLAFDELLALQVGMVARRRQRGRAAGRAVRVEPTSDREIRASLLVGLGRRSGRPVEFTADQEVAIGTLSADLATAAPMLRLLQGDVGSGKTAVAAWALAATARAGRQAALLAPTDLLARQHQRTLLDLLSDLSLPVELLVGSLPVGEARRVRALAADGRAPIVVGTHALMSDAVEFHDLALAVVDEQHRFGVDQRAALEAKARHGAPHVLLMTATPIPRTLGQVVYADLEVSDLRVGPAGRTPVTTGIKHPDDLASTWAWVEREAAAGRRTFVVVPRISDPDADEADDGSDAGSPAWAAAAESEAERLRGLLPRLRIGMVHGRLRPLDRDAEMTRFRDGELDVLVGTTVVEVGVDVPEASLMVVEGAERFGIAQLHQLRGRVGRGDAASYCVLVSDAAPSTEAWGRLAKGELSPESPEQARLVAVRSTTSGFELAERDWELRREGDVLGLAQSGLPRLRVASIARADHQVLAARARRHAEDLVAEDGSLRAGAAAFARELVEGWLARVATGDPTAAA